MSAKFSATVFAFRSKPDGSVLLERWAAVALIGSAAIATYFYIIMFPLNHDVAWLLTATQRWMFGQRLYVDIIEINPPLIFLESVILTGGLLTKKSYLIGVICCIIISSLAILKTKGLKRTLFASAAMISVGITDFGQRDHLALIFITPFLTSGAKTNSGKVSVALWAFLGVGLKPYFVLMPAAFVFANCLQSRSLSPLLEIQNIVLFMACVVWMVIVALVWPQYFSSVVPLARFVYPAFGIPPKISFFIVSLILLFAILLIAKRKPSLLSLAFAAGGAILEFYLQGRFWTYHFIPALGLTAILCFDAGISDRGVFRGGLIAASLALLAWPLWAGPNRYRPSVIPLGVNSVLILTDQVSKAYPEVFECGVTNSSRYPTLWTIPGAWNRLRQGGVAETKAKSILAKEFSQIKLDLDTARPEIVFEDTRNLYLKDESFSYSRWINLDGYQKVGKRGSFKVWLRKDISTSIMDRPTCYITGH